MSIVVGDNFDYKAGKPLDGRVVYATLADMKAVADSTMYNGCLAYCVATDKTYQWKSSNTVEPDTGKWREFTTGGGGHTIENARGTDMTQRTNLQFKGATVSDDSTNDRTIIETEQVQLLTMPTAAAGNVGQIVQYVGASDANYTKGYFYQCVENSGAYSWENIAVEPVSGFDYSNEFGAENILSLTERMIGQYTDGKPLYQKTVLSTFSNANKTWKDEPHNIANIDKIAGYFGSINNDINQNIPLMYAYGTQTITTIVTNTTIGTYTNDYVRVLNRPMIVTIQYTKTTDSAMSIGVANEYSTTEKIVGTWIDGKPIYQKTVGYTITSPTDSWKICPHNIQNLEKVIYGFGSIKTFDGNNWVIGGYRESQAFSQLLVNVTNIMVYTPANNIYENASVYVTVQYTKTTD